MAENIVNNETYQDYWTDIIAECESDLKGANDYPQSIFYEKYEDLLLENNLFNSLDFHYFESHISSKRYKPMHIDYGSVDSTDNSINLLTIDYDPSHLSTITNEKQSDYFNRMVNFVANAINGYFQENNMISDSIYPFVSEIICSFAQTDNLNLFLLSSNIRSNVLKPIEPRVLTIGNKQINVTFKVIDIQYLFNSSLSNKHSDPINIVVRDIDNGKTTGIKCLSANIPGDDYQAYLAVLPGTFLSEIYRLYGGRLLEKNVRSFLSTKGSVNKGIRNTIRTEPNKFFTYNNGIACTAASITCEQRSDGLYITSLNDLQIINGGQTTASLRNAVLTDKDHIVDLTKVFVPMKLTVISQKVSDDDREIMVSNISKYSNSQNKVSNSDLNSNSPFYVQLEKISRQTFTPTMTNGQQTRWFFERSRGQYERDQMELTKTGREKFKAVNPRSQLLRVTDLAKYYNSVDEKPFRVSWGGQVNAEEFQKTMQSLYEKDNNFVTQYFFKTLVAQAILFNEAKAIIKPTEEYQAHLGILAQVVTYTISRFIHLVKEKKLDLDWKDIWTKQTLPTPIKEELKNLGIWTIEKLTDVNRKKDNVGEWAKLKECWDQRTKQPYTLSSETIECLVSPEENKAQETSAKKDERATKSTCNGIYIFKLGASYWTRFKSQGCNYNKFSSNVNDFKDVSEAIKSCQRGYMINSQRTIENLIRLKKEFEEEGIIEKTEPADDPEEADF